MQVQPLLPSRRVFIEPSAWAWTIVALSEIAAGAADIALATGSLFSAAAVCVPVSFASAVFASPAPVSEAF
jgi:hypothetical protein